MTSKTRDPLEPIAAAARVITALAIAFTGLVIVATVFGSGSIMGFGDSSACVRTSTSGIGVPDSGAVVGLHDGASAVARVVDLCSFHASAGDRALNTLSQIPPLLLFVGSFWLLMRLISVARREGFFTDAVASRLRTLGWFLVVGGLVARVVVAIFSTLLARHLVDVSVMDAFLGFLQPNYLLVVTGLGVVSFGRVMAHSVPMREELEATV